jgi:hypothetical protein
MFTKSKIGSATPKRRVKGRRGSVNNPEVKQDNNSRISPSQTHFRSLAKDGGRMARGGNALPKVSLGPLTFLCPVGGPRATPKTALQSFLEWPARRASSSYGRLLLP